jgi:hypothetical protein
MAYIVLADPAVSAAQGKLSPVGLRDHLRARLPEYMVPAAFVPLAQIPLTANGKLDRRALRLPAASALTPFSATRADDHTPDVDIDIDIDIDIEHTVARIWRDVLHRGQIGVDENFFDAGGNSLLLMHVLIGLRTELSASLTRVDMFRYPTIRTMARYLGSGALQPAGAREPAGAAAPTEPGEPARVRDLTRQSAPGGRQNLAELRRRRRDRNGGPPH